MNYFKPKKARIVTITYKIKPVIEAEEAGKVKQIIPYKEAPRAVKNKVEEIRKRWLSYRNFFARPFVFQFRKIYLRLDGVQKKGESIYYMWTILYNRNPDHRNSTTIAVRFEDFLANNQ